MKFLLLIFVLAGLNCLAAAEDKLSEFYQISTSPDGKFALGVAYEPGHSPRVSQDSKEKSVQLVDEHPSKEDGDVVRQKAAIVEVSSKRLIQTFDFKDAGVGAIQISGSWSSDSKHLAVGWDVYRWDWGVDLWKIFGKAGGRVFIRESVPEKILASAIRHDPEFHQGLTLIFRPLKWQDTTLLIECIPAQTHKESSHPFDQGEKWYQVALKPTKSGSWKAVELRTDGEDYTVIWKTDK